MRKRDQTPDVIGLAVKRALLERAVADDPDPQAFEAWLVRYVQSREGGLFQGAVGAMARAVFEEWRLAQEMGDFGAWLERGAPSEDAARSTEILR